jgi:hypothetical protein
MSIKTRIEDNRRDANSTKRGKRRTAFDQLNGLLKDGSATTRDLNSAVADWKANPQYYHMTPNEVLDHVSSYSPRILPDARTYSMIVHVAIKWIKKPSDGPRFAEAVLDRMEIEAETNLAVMPDAVMYGTVINAWARSGVKEAPYKAEALLQKMQDLYESGNHDVKPNTISFNSVVTAWARSNNKAAAERAKVILN